MSRRNLDRVHNIQLAISLSRVVTELYPTSPNAWDSLGESYRAQGDRAKSVAAYSHALELDPKFPTALRALAELEQE